MAEDDVGAVEGQEGSQQAAEGLLLGRFKDADALGEAYKQIQSTYTKEHGLLQGVRNQLEAAGFEIDQDGIVKAPDNWGFVGDVANAAGADDDEYVDPKVKALEARLAAQEAALNSLTQQSAVPVKSELLSHIKAEAQEEAAGAYDKAVRAMPAAMRTPENLAMVKDLVLGQQLAKGNVVYKGASQSSAADLASSLAGASDRAGSDGGETVTATAEMRTMYDKFGLAERGIKFEDYVKSVKESRR